MGQPRIFSFSFKEKVPAEQGDEVLAVHSRPSSVIFDDTFSRPGEGR
jgi:hypothetical protein